MNNKQQLLADMFVEEKNFNQFFAIGNEIALHIIANSVNHIIHIVGAKLSGKTHLLKSWVNQAVQNQQLALYIDCKLLKQYSDDIRKYNFIALDNIEYMSEGLQLELFDLCNQIKLYNNTSFILTSSTNRLKSSHLRQDLTTRLLSGLVISLKRLEDQYLFFALKQYIDLECFKISDNEIKYLINHCNRSLGVLIKHIKELSLYATAQKKPITKHVLKEYLQEKGIDKGNKYS